MEPLTSTGNSAFKIFSSTLTMTDELVAMFEQTAPQQNKSAAESVNTTGCTHPQPHSARLKVTHYNLASVYTPLKN